MALFVTANLGRGVNTAEFLRNVEEIDDEAGPGAIIGLQEIDEADQPDEHGGLRFALDAHFAFAGWDTRVPIAYGEKWAKISEHVAHASSGLFRLSPERVITELVVRHARKGLPPLVGLNVHFPRNDRRLFTRWHQVERKLKARIAHWHDLGCTVVWMGDANRADLPLMHPRERTLAHDGLDWIRVVEHSRGLQIECVEVQRIDLTIDGHDALCARVRLGAPKV